MERLPCAPSRGPIESWQALRNRPASPQTKKLASPFSFLLPAEKQAVFLFPYFTQAAFLRGGAKRPACQWQERPLGRRAPRESPETSGGSGSEPTRRLRLRKGGPSLPPKNQTVKKVSNKLAECNEGRPALHFFTPRATPQSGSAGFGAAEPFGLSSPLRPPLAALSSAEPALPVRGPHPAAASGG